MINLKICIFEGFPPQHACPICHKQLRHMAMCNQWFGTKGVWRVSCACVITRFVAQKNNDEHETMQPENEEIDRQMGRLRKAVNELI